jgi:hypothetical protein
MSDRYWETLETSFSPERTQWRRKVSEAIMDETKTGRIRSFWISE